jgi:hypothetical protein
MSSPGKRHIPENITLQDYHYKNLKSYEDGIVHLLHS